MKPTQQEALQLQSDGGRTRQRRQALLHPGHWLLLLPAARGAHARRRSAVGWRRVHFSSAVAGDKRCCGCSFRWPGSARSCSSAGNAVLLAAKVARGRDLWGGAAVWGGGA